MNVKIDKLKGKNFLLLFVFVMILNAFLTAFLFRASFGQTQEDDSTSQEPIKVEVTDQKDCPLQITVDYVDNSALSFQNINYSFQNTSNKSIRAYILLGDGRQNGKTITSFFVAKLLHPSEFGTDGYPVERQSITKGETILLSIDYVEFADGSSWGHDTQGKSKEIAGEREGIKTAIKKIRSLLRDQSANNTNELTSLFNQDIKEINVDIPEIDQSDAWKRGFRGGYKAAISVLKKMKEQGDEILTRKLDQMERIVN